MTAVAPIHPGEHLAEILAELGISQYRLAKAIGVPPIRISEIVRQRRSVTADTALRVGRALGMTPEFWLNLQRMYDLELARASTDTSKIEPLVKFSALLEPHSVSEFPRRKSSISPTRSCASGSGSAADAAASSSSALSRRWR